MLDHTSKIIDVDVHNSLKSHRDLLPYLSEAFQARLLSSGMGMPSHGYQSPVGVSRQDCKPPNGGPSASDPDFLIKDLMEPFNIEYAILTGDLMGVSAMHDPDYAAAIASAYNDYIAKEWLPYYPQLRGSILISANDPLLAVREIERWAGHPNMVGIIMGSGQRALLGQRQFHPIYEAAEKHGYPVAIHPGTEGSGGLGAPTASGYPTNYLQWHTCLPQNYMAHTVSLVCEGVFEKFPQLKFVMLEGGIAWIPHLLWRLDKNYKGLRSSVPWLKRMPSEYIRDHIMFSTQPIEEPGDPKDLLAIFDMIDAENFLMFSTDYPHWDNDMPTEILRKLRPEARQKIFYDNAKKLYKL